jgi:hypothetical protein
VRVQGKGINRTEIKSFSGRTSLEIAGDHPGKNSDYRGRNRKARYGQEREPSLGAGDATTGINPSPDIPAKGGGGFGNLLPLSE